MKIIELEPGSAEWLQHRTASQASIIMGCSPYCTRSELLRMKAIGGEKAVSEWAQKNLLDRGHEIEERARVKASEQIQDDLFPACGTTDDGYLSASFDGITMDGTITWECKSWNYSKSEVVRNDECPIEDYWQVVQQAIVSDAAECWYEVTDGNGQSEMICVDVRDSDRVKLIAAWRQFDEDLANYVPQEIIPEPVATPTLQLPAVFVQVAGSIQVRDNLAVFGDALKEYVARINKSPETDQDFADLEDTVKTLKAAEEALNASESSALAQVADVDTLRRTVALYRDTARNSRLAVEKIVKAEKENRRAKIVMHGQEAFRSHVATLDKRLGSRLMPAIQTNFPGVVKGLKTITSIQNAVDTELARVKIEANAVADTIQANRDYMLNLQADFLFPEFAAVCTKPNDDFRALCDSRLAQHKHRQEEERARIRAEEEAKARASVEKQQEAAQTVASADTQQPAAVHTPQQTLAYAETAERKDDGARLKLGEINSRLGFTVTAEFLASIGFKPVAHDKNAKLYRSADFNAICAAICGHVDRVSRANQSCKT